MIMFEAGKTYRTRDGREARVYATDGAIFCIHGAIKTESGWVSDAWGPYGKYPAWQFSEDNAKDLMPPTRKMSRWVALYRCVGTGRYSASVFATREFATIHGVMLNSKMLGEPAEITWEESDSAGWNTGTDG